MTRPIRIVALSDIHAGHNYGLTHPDYFHVLKRDSQSIAERMWAWYSKTMKSLYPIDILLCNGDALNGNGGGDQFWATESCTLDRFEQVDMAESVLRGHAKDYILSIGTRCHVGNGAEDYEKPLAKRLGGVIDEQVEFEVRGAILHARHDIGGSRYSALAREIASNQQWADRRIRKRADIIIRSHLHIYTRLDDANTTALITPSLELWKTKHGQRNLSSPADFGLVVIDIASKRDYNIRPILNNDLLKANCRHFSA